MASPPTITNANDPPARRVGSISSATSSDPGAVVLTVFDPETFESVKRFANVLDTKELAATTRLKDAKKKHLLEARRKSARQKERRRFWSSRTLSSTTPAVNFDADVERSAIDVELGGAYLPQCLKEIKTCLVIKSHPIYAQAQETWTARKREFTGRVDRKQKNVSELTNGIYQLIGVLSVFQGVLYTGVSQSSLLHCNNRWSPITLSVAASVLVIAGVIDKFLRILEFKGVIHTAVQSLKIVQARLNALERLGVEEFEFSNFHNEEKAKQSLFWFWTYFFIVVGALLIFAAGFPLSHWRILCDPGRA